jgi:polar amino acid transport system substrate-binding protein
MKSTRIIRRLWILFCSTVVLAGPVSSAPITVMGFSVQPFSYEENKKAVGLSVDLLTRMSQDAGLNLPLAAIQPLPRVLEALDAGDTIAVAIVRTPEREGKYQWIAESYLETVSFATLSTTPVINSYEDAKNAGNISALRGSMLETTLRNNGVTSIELGETDETSGFQMLLLGRTKAQFSSTSTLKLLITQFKAQDKVKLGKPILNIDFWIVASKNIPIDTITKLQNAYKKLKANGEYDKIFATIK